MNTYNLDLLLQYEPVPASQAFIKQENRVSSIDSLLNEKVDCLSDILNQINSEIEKRNSLSLEVIDRIYNHYMYLKAKLCELYDWPLTGNRAIELRRSSLEKQLDTLKTEKRQEQIKCWQDVSGLKKEFRTWLKQYCDNLQRIKLLKE